MQTVITIEFDGQLRRIKADTPSDAIAELRGEYEEAGRECNVDLSELSVHCLRSIDMYSLRRFREVTRPCSREVTHLLGNQELN